MAGPDPQDLAAVGAEDRPRAEVVVVDAVVILPALLAVEPYRHEDAGIALPHQVVVIEAVVLAVHHDPVIGLVALRVVEPVDDGLGHARVVRVVTTGAPEGDHRVGGCVTVPEDQSGHDEIFSGHAQVGLPCDEDFPLRFGCQGDRSVGCAEAGEEDFEIPPFPAGQQDRIAGLKVVDGVLEFVLGMDKQRFGEPCLAQHEGQHDQSDSDHRIPILCCGLPGVGIWSPKSELKTGEDSIGHRMMESLTRHGTLPAKLAVVR